MSASGLNLARRPFVDARPANAAVAVLAVAAVVLTVDSWGTVRGYLEGSRVTREAVAGLRSEIDRLDTQKRNAEAGLAKFDLEALSDSAAEANSLARKRAFSWTRFLTRLETALPEDVRVVSIGVSRTQEEEQGGSKRKVLEPGVKVSLSIVCRDPDGLPRVIRAFYDSSYFDQPVPISESGGEKGAGDGRQMSLTVFYLDAGRPR